MNIKFLRLWAVVLAAGVLGGTELFAKDPEGKGDKQSLRKTAGDPTYAVLNINNLTAWFRYDGHSNHSPGADNGLYFPRGTANVIYQDGVVYAGKAFVGGLEGVGTPAPNQTVRVGGGTYGVGTRGGYVTGQGNSAVAADPGDADVRIYRIRRDYTKLKDANGNFTDDLRRDAANVNEIPTAEVTDGMMTDVYQQYVTDWIDWPINRGAPYIDRDGDGIYTAPPPFGTNFTVDSLIAQGVDEPGIAGADPNSPADQVIWTVYNDLNESTAQGFVSSDPLGLEIQKTIWGYKRSDALGNLYFSKYKLINKGGVDTSAVAGAQLGTFYIDSMYVCQWSDPDLGSFSDDLAGCDTALSMGFIYNGNAVDGTFRNYGLAPAAAGYDFLAGPIVPSAGDTAVFDLKLRPGFRNLGMSSFAYFSAGSSYDDPPNPNTASGYSVETGQWWKMLRGFAPLGAITDADIPYAFPPGLTPDGFPLSGNPATGSGFLDGQGELYSFAPGDRRILLNTGPFYMNPGDTQEIVVGVVAGLGSDRLSSVTVMKFNDRFVQNTYDARFQVPSPPAAPDVKVAEMDGQLILDWASNPAQQATIEQTITQPGSFTFEGYNVYQLPSANAPRSQWTRVATYDLTTDPAVILDEQVDEGSGQVLSLPVQFGSNSGLKRDFIFDRDYVLDVDKIYNGQEYYLVVTAYSRSAIPGYLPAALESDPIVRIARPKVPFGKVYETSYGDTISVSHTGLSDGSVVPVVVNPTLSTGDTYEVRFDSTGGVTTWFLRNVTDNVTLLSGQTNQSGDEEYAIVDGIRVKVQGPPLVGKSYSYASASPANLSPVAVAEQAYAGGRWLTGGSHGGELFFGGVFMEPNFWGATTLGPADYKPVEIRFSPMQSYTDLTGDGEFTIGEPYVVTGPHTQNAFMYQTFSGGAYQGFNPIPFTAWDVSNPGSPVQLNVVVRDRDANGQWELHRDNTGVTNAAALPNAGDLQFGYTWITNTPYDATGTYYGDGTGGTIDFFAGAGGAVIGGMWAMWVDDRGTGGMLAEESFFTLTPNLVNTVNDVFSFVAPAASGGSTTEMASVDRAGVFPNPYYAFNAAETNRFSRFVTFNNLPPKATIRIFNLAGQLVRRIDKDDPSQFLRWDLANASNFPVASGMYIAHLELTLPGDNSVVTKVLKLAVIQEQEILNSY